MKPVFRNAMFGFNKEDVFAFISKQSKQYEQKIGEISSERDLAQKELELAKTSFDEFKEETEAKRIEIKKSISLLEDVKFQISRILEQETEIRDCLNSCEGNADSMKKNIIVLQDKAARGEAYREKALKFEQLSSALSGIFGDGEKKEETNFAVSLQDMPLEDFSVESFAKLKDYFEKLTRDLNTLSDLCDKFEIINE